MGWNNSRVPSDEIRPYYPQEVLVAVRKSPTKLEKLFGCQDSNAPKLHALAVQKTTSGTPNSSAAVRVKLITTSETMQVTGGTFDELLSLKRRSLNGAKQCLLVESQMVRTSGMASVSLSDGGIPSGIISNRKEERPLSEFCPRDLRRR
ncbi:hypothetical protein RJ640_006601 [Escallonia rubra]|uniref:Uncharacterized protein n=1 Tax=Escallonia rubra TaxID=112253 RepID=A0AA88R9Z7_9ASTE|nr:hypothetical protein RJ640_006601 [Escallonia rubra]